MGWAVGAETTGLAARISKRSPVASPVLVAAGVVENHVDGAFCRVASLEALEQPERGFRRDRVALDDLAIEILGVASRTTQAITDAASCGVGVAGKTSQFGGLLGIGLGSNNIGVIGPSAFYANTPIRVTAAGGDFTGWPRTWPS